MKRTTEPSSPIAQPGLWPADECPQARNRPTGRADRPLPTLPQPADLPRQAWSRWNFAISENPKKGRLCNDRFAGKQDPARRRPG